MSASPRLCFYIQNHLPPARVQRLVATLRAQDAGAVLLVMHDPFAGHCDTTTVRGALPGVTVLETAERARRGYFSALTPWLRAITWLHDNAIGYDWLITLSAQDYPVRPMSALRAFLETTPFDAFLRHWDATAPDNPWGRRRQGRRRYFLQYFDVPAVLRPLLPVARRLNGIQSLLHVHLLYGPRVGLRWPTPFRRDLQCWAGLLWTILRRDCVEYVLEQTQRQVQLLRWFARTITPEEAVIQTLLVNAGRFRLSNDDLRYMNYRGTRDGSPQTLTLADLTMLYEGGYYFARKFDAGTDAQVLDALDAHLAVPASPTLTQR